MEPSVDRTRSQVAYTQSNPLFDRALSSSDLFQPEGKTRRWVRD